MAGHRVSFHSHAAEPPEHSLAAYRAELAICRAVHGGSYDVRNAEFFKTNEFVDGLNFNSATVSKP